MAVIATGMERSIEGNEARTVQCRRYGYGREQGGRIMDREDIIKLAREAGFDPHDMSDDFSCNLIDIERFAALVAAAEREACAKACDELKPFGPHLYIQKATAQDCAAAIRARGNK